VMRPPAVLTSRRQGHPCPLAPCRASARRPHLRAAVFVRVVARSGRSGESAGIDCRFLNRWAARGCPCQSSGVDGRAQPGWRSEASIERPEGRMPAGSVRRDGMDSPEPASPWSVRATGSRNPSPAPTRPQGAFGGMARAAPSLRHPGQRLPGLFFASSRFQRGH
jgi:hypothetical protein